MEQHFRNYQTNHKFLEKGRGYYCWKPFQKLLEYISQSPQYNRAGRARAGEEMFKRKLTKNQAYLEKLVPQLKNPTEEAIFGSNTIKEENKTMKLQNEEIMLKNT